MGSLKLYATLAGLLAVAASTTVRAADLLPPPPPLEAPPFEVGGGWYLRGDVGVSAYDAGKISNVSSPDITYYDKDFGSGAFAGAGVGYQFNNWFRADITGEYRFSTGFKWNDRGGVSTQTAFGGLIYTANGTSYEKTSGDYSAAVVLVNGYFDLGTWYGITPFVGAGVGWNYHWTSGGTTSTVNAFGNYVGPDGFVQAGSPPSGVSGGSIRDHGKGDLAWALHAGLGYDVSPNLKLEVAYRYLNLGSTQTGLIDCYCNQVYAGTKVKDLESHDIKIGMRWMLGGPVLASMPQEPYGAPIVRKY
jgi:opacity protein-like surface antigen